MKKKLLSLLLCATLAAGALAGCGGGGSTTDTGSKSSSESKGGDSGKKQYAIVPKSAGNPYNEKEVEGFKAIIEANGGEAVVNYPQDATADAQITVINSLISQGVDSIAVAANDENALQSVLEDAMSKGIKVSCLDSSVNADSRQTFANQAGVKEVAQALCDAVYDISGGSGDWAILSASSQATNQNAWIEAMKGIMADDSKYADLNLVEVAYGDDETQKSTDQTQALLANYPNLKVICAPTTVGVAAAAKVVQDTGATCRVTGLGLPSEMAEYIGKPDSGKSCPYMFLWNPIDLGKLSAYISLALVDGTITGAVGDTFEAKELGVTYTITEAADGGTEVILGAPFEFNPDNIEEWKTVY